MQPERVVEIRQGGQSVGSGYLIAPRYVLTAKHVVQPAIKGTACQVWPLGSVGDEMLPLSKRKRPAKRKARLDWLSATRDLAILVVEGDGISGIPPRIVPFGQVRDDGLSYRYVSSGLP